MGAKPMQVKAGAVIAAVALMALLVVPSAAAEVSPSTIQAGNIVRGENKAVQLSITNSYESMTEFELTASKPSLDLKGNPYVNSGYESIPDASWISFEQSTVTLGAGQTASVTIYITVPDDEGLENRKFEAHVSVDPLGGSGVSGGERVRLDFAVVPPTIQPPEGGVDYTLLIGIGAVVGVAGVGVGLRKTGLPSMPRRAKKEPIMLREGVPHEQGKKRSILGG